MDLGQAHLARGIEGRLASSEKAKGLTKERRAAIAHAQAGALFSLLDWWIKRGKKESPAQMDDLFHEMLWKGLR
jgi:hypothetical protein